MENWQRVAAFQSVSKAFFFYWQAPISPAFVTTKTLYYKEQSADHRNAVKSFDSLRATRSHLLQVAFLVEVKVRRCSNDPLTVQGNKC